MKFWDIKRTTFSVADFLSWQTSNELELSPRFQRRQVWKSPAKSFLIDTIIRGLPIPILFLRERTDIESLKTIREVVDGQQRLRTVISFCDKNLLKDYDQEKEYFTLSRSHNRDLAGKEFLKLPNDIKRRILSYNFSVHVLPSDTADADVIQIFRRMNATGSKLTAQELRNAQFFGEFITSVYESASKQLDRWRSWGVLNEDNIARMEEAEITSDIYGLMIEGLSGRSSSSLKGLYTRFDEYFDEREIIEERFETTFELIDEAIGRSISSMVFRRKTLFYVLFALFYDVAYGIGSPLEKSKVNRPIDALSQGLGSANRKIEEKTASDKLLEATSRRTTHISTRRVLFNFLRSECENAYAQ